MVMQLFVARRFSAETMDCYKMKMGWSDQIQISGLLTYSINWWLEMSSTVTCVYIKLYFEFNFKRLRLMKQSMFMWFNIFQARRIHFRVLFFLHWITIPSQPHWNPFYTKMIRKWSIYHLLESELIGWWLLMTCKVKMFSSMVKKQHSQTRESHLDSIMLWPLTPLTMSSYLVILMVFSSITINKNFTKMGVYKCSIIEY